MNDLIFGLALFVCKLPCHPLMLCCAGSFRLCRQGSKGQNSLLALAVVPQELQRRPAEHGESGGVVVAPIDAASPDGAVAGLQEGGGQALHLPPPHLYLDVVEEEIARLLEGVYLQGAVMASAGSHTMSCCQ